MATCFLFTQHKSEEHCLSVRLDQKGQLEAPLIQRSWAEIKSLQADNTQTYIVVPGQQCTFQQVEIPRLADRKARAAIPFAIEDQLSQNVDTLHFAFDNNHYQEGKYLVAVCDKNDLKELIAFFDTREINFDRITVDWFALQSNEIAILEDASMLINDDRFQGLLSADLAPFYLEQYTANQVIYCFPDSNKSGLKLSSMRLLEHSEPSYLWLAQRLLKTKPLNLCQGQLQHGSNLIKTKRLYQAALGMSLLWLLSLIGVNLIKLHALNTNLATIDEKIAVVYREFFPQAHQIISPKFRISQLLKANQNNSDLVFWSLLDKLAQATQSNHVTIEQLRFQNQTLLVTLATKSFESLEDFQTTLQNNHIQVKQTQASTLNQQVVSTLELNL